MSKENDEYKYQVKGKNGESKKGVLIDFQFKNKYYYKIENTRLKTDKDGNIYLGKLKNIIQVTICISYFTIGLITTLQ